MRTLFIENLVLNGTHGATTKEMMKTQPFQIDIVVEVGDYSTDVDDLEGTLDYRILKRAAEKVVLEEQHTLIETIARRIACLIKGDARVHRVKVTVRKLAIWKSGVPGTVVEVV